MKHIKNRKMVRDDNLIFAVQDLDAPDKIFYQRKRLPDNTCIERIQDRDKYFEVECDTIQFIRYLRKKYDWRLRESVEYILLITGRKTLLEYVIDRSVG